MWKALAKMILRPYLVPWLREKALNLPLEDKMKIVRDSQELESGPVTLEQIEWLQGKAQDYAILRIDKL